MTKAFDLSGRVALVTGAGSPEGIGFASAQLLAELGAAVLVTSTTDRILERVAELRAAGAEAEGMAGDLTLPETAADLVSTAVRCWGRLDILVNNAGMVSVSDPVPGSDVAVWRTSLARNLDTAFFATRAALPVMTEAGWGRVIMVASLTGPVMAMAGEPGYAAAKAGMVGLTRALAVDTATAGITVNAVAPGWIGTASQTPAEFAQGLATPIGRSATAAEVAAAVGWLASPGASAITGQCIVVDGGNSIMEERAAGPQQPVVEAGEEHRVP
jgi:3-oxoacyl-[acyl-carrier protein] reductase